VDEVVHEGARKKRRVEPGAVARYCEDNGLDHSVESNRQKARTALRQQDDKAIVEEQRRLLIEVVPTKRVLVPKVRQSRPAPGMLSPAGASSRKLDDEEKDRRAEARRKEELEDDAKTFKSSMFVHNSDNWTVLSAMALYRPISNRCSARGFLAH
jgi:hypothetical protein